MSACSGRNYNFLCINVVFCVFLRDTARTAELTLAQIREKLPNGWTDWHQIWHTYADSSGNGYTPNKLPLETQGALGGGFRGSNIQKCWEAVKRLDRLAPTLVGSRLWIHLVIYAKQISPRFTRGHMRGFRGSNIQKSGEYVKRLDRLALVHVCGFVWEWT